jgi:hypothetical protein
MSSNYRYENFFGLLKNSYPRPAKVLKDFDACGIMNGGGRMSSE